MGGGTPSLLSPAQFSDICTSLADSFDLSAVEEFTVTSDKGASMTFSPEGTYVFRAADGGTEESGGTNA